MDSHLARHRAAEARLQEIAALIEGALPEGVVFVLIAATVGTSGFASYVSNGQRDDMVRLLKEQTERLEAKTDSGPFADVEELEMKRNRKQRRKEAKRGK